MKHRSEGTSGPPKARAGSRRRRRHSRHPVWLASLGVLAILAAAIGWNLAPTGDSTDGASTIEAAAAHPNQHRGRPSASPTPSVSATARGTTSPAPSPAAGGTGTGKSGATGASGTSGTASGSRTTTTTAPRTTTPTRAPAAPVVAPPAVSGGGAVPGGMSGLAAGSLTQVNAWAAFRGSPVTAVVTFSDRSSWQTITNPWLGSGPEKLSTFAGTWVISQPFFPNGQGDMNSCANGAYSSQWASFGRWLVAKGRPASIVRLAWEFNGDWFPWSVSKTNATTWVSCFRQVVSAIRSTDPQARIDWALNAHSGGAWSVYPGDAYVDIIGVDTYDHWPASTSDATFATQCAEATGLCSAIAFARQHGKQFSVPEWGLVGKSDTGAGRAGTAGGDNPVYIRDMYNTFKANKDILAYESYFNDSAPGNVHSSLLNPNENPNGAATYASLW
ncbi:glycoside hydrolase family 26 protein [Candidatus Frankia nodulisporulans]|uniref:glycoside hydrolase family 26 protein n=1 Tax=Candidatus Frankia nodulisporulans TaxID=2060052 RepID=UPI0013D7EB33|nr:glycosyl hydrolase [Candidatus Frankia nodulisporulans]